MTSPARWGRAARLAAAAVVFPLACVARGEPEAGSSDPAPSAIVPDASTAGADAAAVPDAAAGRCSASRLCVEEVPIDEFVHLTSVWGSGATDVWAVGAHGTILHYDGVAWRKAEVVAPDGGLLYTLRSVWLERPDDVWIVDGTTQVGGGGLLRHGVGWKGPSATTWTFFTPSDPSGFEPLIVRGKSDTVWIAHAGHRLLEAFDGWSGGAPGPSRTLAPARMSAVTALAVSRADEVWAAGSCFDEAFVSRFGCVFRGSLSTAGPVPEPPAWRFEEHDSRTNKALRGAWGDESGAWLVGDAGTLRRMTRSAVPGKKLEIVKSPVVADLRGVFGFGPDDVWAVGEASTVLHWDGAVWTKLATPFDDASDRPMLHAVWGSSPSDVWIVGDGTVLHFDEVNGR